MILRKSLALLVFGYVVLCGAAGGASAEVDEVKIARQYGIGYLPMMIMEQDRLIEKHARVLGL